MSRQEMNEINTQDMLDELTDRMLEPDRKQVRACVLFLKQVEKVGLYSALMDVMMVGYERGIEERK